MREIVGNLWNYYGRENFVVLITTSGSLRKNGKAIMGRGCAKEATLKIPGVEKLVGAAIQNFGNVLLLTDRNWGTFPTKHEWWEDSDPELIRYSAIELSKMTKHKDFANKTFVLPRPGCGQGHLQWADVKPILEECGLGDGVWVVNRDVF